MEIHPTPIPITNPTQPPPKEQPNTNNQKTPPKKKQLIYNNIQVKLFLKFI